MSDLKMPNLLKQETENTGLVMPNLLTKGAGTQSVSRLSGQTGGNISKQWVNVGAGRKSTSPVPQISTVPQVEEPTLLGRIKGTVSGAAKASASDYANLGGTVLEGLGKIGSALQDKKEARQIAQDMEYLARYERELAEARAAGDQQAAKLAQIRIDQTRYRLKNAGALGDYYDQVNREAAGKVYTAADKLDASAAEDINAAKAGLGKVGQFVVDAGVAGGQLAGDMLLAAATGGSTVVPMAARVFGGSAQEARQTGASFGEQLAYGAGSAALSGLTEKLGNVGVFKKAFGAGVLDKAISKVAQKPAGKIVASALSEGGEEFLEAVAQPILQKLTYDPESGYDEEWLGEALYGAAIGALLGSSGAAVSPSTYSKNSAPAVLERTETEQIEEARKIAENFGATLQIGKLGNGAAGEYQSGIVTIDPEVGNPVRQVLVHELTHHMESSGLYSQFSEKVLQFAAEDMGVDVEAMLGEIISEYGSYGTQLDQEGARRELVAKFSEDMLFRDERSIQRLLQTDRNLFQRVYDWICDALTKVKGTSEENFLLDAQKLYEKALRGAGEQSGAGVAQNTFGGVNARMADLGRLKLAQQMEQQEGMTVDGIRQETGWFRGADGKWRFEIDDSGMEYRRTGDAGRLTDPEYREYLELWDKGFARAEATEEELERLRELDARYGRVGMLSSINISNGNATLGDILVHDELFRSYPELKSTGIRFGDLPPGTRAEYWPGRNEIILNNSLRGAPEDTLIHEIQHAIQRKEGFAGGANTGYWQQGMQEGLSIHEHDGRIKKAEEEYRRIFDSAPEEFKNQVRALNRARLAEDYDTEMAIEEGLYSGVYADLYSELSMADFTRRGNRGEELTAEDLYRNTAGEIEARDAAARRTMSQEQRELRMPRLGDENTVFVDRADTAKDFIPGVIEPREVLQGIQDVARMQPVTGIRGTEFAKGEVDLVTQVTNFFNSIGGMVFNPQLGDVKLTRSGVRADIAHGIGRKKAAAFAAVPAVLEHGKVIDYQTDWKGRQYDTAVVAAPITIGEESYLAGVVLTRNQRENSFYVHEVLLTEKGTAPFKTGGRKSDVPGGDAPSVLSLLREVQTVKENSSTNTELEMPRLTRHDEGQFSMGRSFRELAEPPVRRSEPTIEELLERADGSQMTGRPISERQRTQDALGKLGVHIVGDMGNYENIEFVRGADEGRKELVSARQAAERRLKPSRREQKFAHGIAEGDYTADDIPASMDRDTVLELADYYYAEDTFRGTDGVQTRGRAIRKQAEQLAAALFKDDESFRPISMLKMNERTPERIMRNIFGKHGETINREYIYPVQQNEAEKVRFIRRQLDEVRTFEDSKGHRSELTRDERRIVQQIMEDRFVEESVASMEVASSIRNAAENIRHGGDPSDAAKTFYLDAREGDLAKQLARWMQNQELLESGKMDSVKINHAVEKFSQQYDLFYDAVNDFLTAHGYRTIGFIKGYAPHMQGQDTQNRLLSALRSMGVNTDASDLPTSISGLTADYKPGKRWNPFFQTRVGEQTDYDVSAGYESYVSYLGDILYHTDDIARLRGISRYLRKTYAPEELSHQIDHAESLRDADLATQMEVLKDAGKISAGSKLTYTDARMLIDSYIDELYENVDKVSKYGEFVKYIDNFANLLAGKQSMADRGMEYTAGRTSLNAGNKLVSAFARAQVAGNLSSVLNQSAQLSQIMAEVDGKHLVKAAVDLVKSTEGKIWNIKATELFDQSDLLTGKKGIEYLTADDKKMDRLVTALFKPADIMDGLVAALAVQSKYNQLTAEGRPAEAAMLEADRWATSVMASRMKGSRPLAFESKNVINQMIHMFQVEALNSWEHVTVDLPGRYKQIEAEHGKKAASRAVATVATKGLISAFLLNRITEAAYGGTPAPFDVLGYIASFVSSGLGMSTNEWLKHVLNSGWEKLFGEALFDEEKKEKQPFDLGAAVKNLGYNASNDVPFLRNAMGVLGLGDQTMPFTNMAEAAKGVGTAVASEERTAGEVGGALLELGSTMLPGGRQIQKTAQGLQTMKQGGRHYGYGDNKRLQYPVEPTPGNWAQAVMFGNSGLEETRQYYASGISGLSAKQTDAVELLVNEGGNRTAAYNAVLDIKEAGSKTADKMSALRDAEGLNDRQKWQLYTMVIATDGTKKAEQFRQMLLRNMTWDEITDTYLEYNRLDELEDVSAVEKATQFAVWLDQSGLNDSQKEYVKDSLKYYSQIPAEAQRYEAFTDLGLQSGDAQGLSVALGNLEPEGDSSSVSNLQRYEAVVNYSGLSESEQITVLKDMMGDSEFENLATAYNTGVSLKQYISFKQEISGLSADVVNGKTVSGSKKAKVMGVIDAMPISNSQKTALYYAAGYKESTLDEAPWYGEPDEDIMPRLTGTQKISREKAENEPQELVMPKLW